MTTRLLSFSSFLQAFYKLLVDSYFYTKKLSFSFPTKKSLAFWGSSFSSYRFLKIYSNCENFETLIRFSGRFYNFSTNKVIFPKNYILSAFKQKKFEVFSPLGSRVIDF